jgi:hypothetical protein
VINWTEENGFLALKVTKLFKRRRNDKEKSTAQTGNFENAING